MPKVVDLTLDDHSALVISAMKKQAALAFESIGQEAEGYAKEDCPVDTGRLRDSISHVYENDEQAAYIGTNVEYGVYVEYGDYAHTTGKKHFLRDAAANHADHYKAVLEAALKA